MRIILVSILLLSGISASAQYNDAEAKANVRQAAIFMGDALIRKDFRTFVLATTYPDVIKKTDGGAEKLITTMDKQMQQIEKSGNRIVAAWPGNPSDIVDTAGELQCTIPQFMKMKLPAGVITSETTLIGMSPDKGKSWYFIDAADQPITAMRTRFPNISSKLVLKAPVEPTFEPGKD